MIRDGDRVAVALSGGKDSVTMLEALLLLQKRAPIDFSVCAFTVEQGKFLRPIEPLGEYLKARGIAWTYFRDAPSLRLLEEQPDHGCDLCSRYRRRAVYEIAARPGLQRDRLRPHRRRFLRSAAAQHHVHRQAECAAAGHPLAQPRLPPDPPAGLRHRRHHHAPTPEARGVPVVPCGCSQTTGTVRRALRDMFAELEREYPHLKENMLSAMGNVDTGRLLDTRFLESGRRSREPETQAEELFPIVTEL